MADSHEVLGVPPGADEATVRSAYRDLLMEHHPDHGGSPERFMQIKDAYERIVEGNAITQALSDGGTVTATRKRAEVTGEAVEDEDGLQLVAEADGLVVRLVALTERLATEDVLPEHVDAGRRVGASFHVVNETGRPVTWKARRIRFVSSQGERYLPTVYRPKRRKLPDRWRGDDVELEPGETARSFLLSRELPEAVAIEAVVYDQQSSAGPTHRVEFTIDEPARSALDRQPFQ